jgi:mannose-6-phosphate isomerase-like protein (cupin superfamily)
MLSFLYILRHAKADDSGLGDEQVMTKLQELFQIDELEQRCRQSGRRYLEFLRVPAMSAGVYTLPAGGTDPQTPHKQDEMYYIVRGRARMRVGMDEIAVRAGSVVFVAAEMEHRFHDITEELVVLVFFAPAES